jgi:hypothetical protein
VRVFGGRLRGGAGWFSLRGCLFSLRGWFSLRDACSLRGSPPGIRPGRRPSFFAGAKKEGKERRQRKHLKTHLSVKAPRLLPAPPLCPGPNSPPGGSNKRGRCVELLHLPQPRGVHRSTCEEQWTCNGRRSRRSVRRGTVITVAVSGVMRSSTHRTRWFEPPGGEFWMGQRSWSGQQLWRADTQVGFEVLSLRAPVETGKESRVQVPHNKDPANHGVPESCAAYREVRGEALTGARIGQPWSRDRSNVPGADTVQRVEGKTSERAIASARTTRRGRRPWHVRKLLAREPGDLRPDRRWQYAPAARIGKARSRSR